MALADGVPSPPPVLRETVLATTREGAPLGSRLGKGAFGSVHVCAEDERVAVKVTRRGHMCFDTWRECAAIQFLRPVDRRLYLAARMDPWGCSRMAMRRGVCALSDIARCFEWQAVPRQERAEIVLPWLRDVQEQLRHAHRAGFVHRDVKLANVLILDSRGRSFGESVAGRGWGGWVGPEDKPAAPAPAGPGTSSVHFDAAGAGGEPSSAAGPAKAVDGGGDAAARMAAAAALLQELRRARDSGAVAGDGAHRSVRHAGVPRRWRAQLVDWGSCIARAEAFDRFEEDVTTWTYRPMDLLCHGIDKNIGEPSSAAHDTWSFGLMSSHLIGWSSEKDCAKAYRQTARVASLVGAGPEAALDALRCGLTPSHWPHFVREARCGVPDVDAACEDSGGQGTAARNGGGQGSAARNGGGQGSAARNGGGQGSAARNGAGNSDALATVRDCVRACLRFAPEDRGFGRLGEGAVDRGASATSPDPPPHGGYTVYPCTPTGERAKLVKGILLAGSRLGFQPHVVCQAVQLFDAACELAAQWGAPGLRAFLAADPQRFKELAAGSLVVAACSLEKYQESPAVIAKKAGVAFERARAACVALFNAMCGEDGLPLDGRAPPFRQQAMRAALFGHTPLTLARARCARERLGRRVQATATYLLFAAAKTELYCTTEPERLADDAIACAQRSEGAKETPLWAWLASEFPDGRGM